MADRFTIPNTGMKSLQAQEDAEENVVRRNIWVNLGNTFKLLPNLNHASSSAQNFSIAIPRNPIPIYITPPQALPEQIANPNTMQIMIMPSTQPSATENKRTQLALRPYKRPQKEIKATHLDNSDEKLHNLRNITQAESCPSNHQSLRYEDLCIHPEVKLPPGYQLPKFNTFDGKGNPIFHLKDYCSRLVGIGHDEAIRMKLFIQSLSGLALEWYAKQDFRKWCTWEDMARDFVRQYEFNIREELFLHDLHRIKRMPHESFEEYSIRWRIEASKLHPPLPERDLISAFIEIQEGIYFEKLVSCFRQNFSKLIQLIKAIEKGIQDGKIIDIPAAQASFQSRMPRYLQGEYEENISATAYRPSKKRKLESFTHLDESLTSIFERLNIQGLLQPRKGSIPKRLPPRFDLAKSCAYHSNIQGHDTEDCPGLRYKIQSMIDSGRIIVCPEPLSSNCSISTMSTFLVKGNPATSGSEYLKRKRTSKTYTS